MQVNRKSYTINQHVRGRVEKVKSYGVFVVLQDGTHAYIRRREMSWVGNIDPCLLTQVGNEIEAVVVNPASEGPRIELSLRALLPDPWLQFSKAFKVGDKVNGRVRDIHAHGIYVEIIPGVDGYVPIAEMAPWPLSKPEDMVWLDDDIEAVITYISSNKEKRSVKLSIRRRFHQLSLANSLMEQLVADTDISQTTYPPIEKNRTETHLGRIDKATIGTILIVEDQDKLRVSLVKWLRRHDFCVESAADVAAALEIITVQSIDICFVDIDLPDSDGLALVRQLHQHQPGTRVIVMSIPDWLAERVEEIEAMDITAVLLKPLDLNEIAILLKELAQGKKPESVHQVVKTLHNEAPQAAFQTLSNSMRNPAPLNTRLQEGMEHLLKLTDAEVGIIFHIETISQMIAITTWAGATKLVNQEAIYTLLDSPVKNVIHQERSLLVDQVSWQNASRFQKLQALLPFESAIGVPIQVGSRTEHALFIFHRRPNMFSRYRLRDVQSIAVLFAVALENQALSERIAAVSSILLSGQLAAGLGHEVFNKISALEVQLINLQLDYKKIIAAESGEKVPPDFQEASQALADVVQTAADLKQTVGLFQSLMRSDKIWEADVDQILLDAKMQLHPILSRDKVTLKSEMTDDQPVVPASPVHLRQVFLNILLNATQHITAKSAGPKEIKITATCNETNSRRPLQIRFIDTGPGIHQKLWQTIFDLGFSTRTDGTGLGLYIARTLIEHMGGSISVEKSTIPFGTTFLVELPILSKRG